MLCDIFNFQENGGGRDKVDEREKDLERKLSRPYFLKLSLARWGLKHNRAVIDQ